MISVDLRGVARWWRRFVWMRLRKPIPVMFYRMLVADDEYVGGLREETDDEFRTRIKRELGVP